MKQVRSYKAAASLSLLALLALSTYTGLAPGGVTRAGLKVRRASAAPAARGERQSEEPADRVSPDLLEVARDPAARGRKVRVILQDDGAALPAALRREAKTRGSFDSIGARVVELPAGLVEQLAAHHGVRFVSLDRETRAFGHVSRTTGTDEVRTTTGTNVSGLDGTGIGIAVIDSGIDTSHTTFLNSSNGLRVVLSKDFTGEGRTDDPFGHGTHVASIAAGNGRISRAEYVGIAPNANVLNLRVLNSQGTGRVSNILAALDWVLQNRAAYNIRVVNLSLGTAALESYRNDPICQAVRKLVDAGVVVAAAAGNNGKDAAGQKLYGAIHSPGDEPSAITVGASNSFGTDWRSDDGVTTYSSRGPTRGYYTDAAGVRRHDNFVKPDLVAPGNKIIDAAAAGNYLLAHNPQLDAGVSPADSRRMMYLNGTSMATPVVAGAAALMLQANPKLTPNLVKALLMYSAQPLAGYNMLEQGAGEVNVEGAVRLAKLVRTDLSGATLLGSPMLTGPAPLPQSSVAGETFAWSQGLVLKYGFVTGAQLITSYQKIYGLGVLVT
ncbi:MAG TPA: S8 family peptidase, partial [Pyrinomonadaceae bacterium]